jgi:HEAT repeat protein
MPLLSVVDDAQVAVRTAAIEALSSFHDPRIPPVLVKALNDLAAPVRREAVTGLSFRPDLREELDLVNQLAPRLYDLDWDVCCSAVIALGRLGTDAAASALYQVLHPNTAAMQIEIVRALGKVGTANGLEYLRLSLNQQLSATVYQEIATVLGRVEQPDLKAQAVDIAVQMLSSDSVAQQESVKQAIALSLGQLREIQAIDDLIQMLADPDTGVRLHAIAALKQLAPEAHQQLEQMVKDKALAADLQRGVAIALQEWSR